MEWPDNFRDQINCVITATSGSKIFVASRRHPSDLADGKCAPPFAKIQTPALSCTRKMWMRGQAARGEQFLDGCVQARERAAKSVSEISRRQAVTPLVDPFEMRKV